MPRVTILRGISGSGKSTWVKNNAQNATVVSADHFFIGQDGAYRFDASRLSENHAKSFKLFLEALERGETWIIVDNTNISAWEYSPYFLAAKAFGYEVEILSFDCSLETSLSRKSLVPKEDLARSVERYVRETSSMPAKFKQINRIVR